VALQLAPHPEVLPRARRGETNAPAAEAASRASWRADRELLREQVGTALPALPKK